MGPIRPRLSDVYVSRACQLTEKQTSGYAGSAANMWVLSWAPSREKRRWLQVGEPSVNNANKRCNDLLICGVSDNLCKVSTRATAQKQINKALWRSWLARRPVTAEVAGSSPVRVAELLGKRVVLALSLIHI